MPAEMPPLAVFLAVVRAPTYPFMGRPSLFYPLVILQLGFLETDDVTQPKVILVEASFQNPPGRDVGCANFQVLTNQRTLPWEAQGIVESVVEPKSLSQVVEKPMPSTGRVIATSLPSTTVIGCLCQ